MAFQFSELSVLGYANGFTLWHYRTPDGTTAVTADGYFDGAAHQLRAGDIILATVETDATPQTAIYTVTGASGGDVTVASV